jgi:para-nitrobenzyl esterase
MAMPGAKGRFHRAIAESGTAQRIATPEQATATVQAILKTAGIDPKDTAKLLAITPGQLVAAQGLNTYGLRPVVDGNNIPQHPFDPTGSPLSADVPMIMGSNETEVTFSQTFPLDPLDDAQLRSQVKEQIKLKSDADIEKMIGLYRRDYPGRPNVDLLQIMASDWGTGDLVQQQLLRKAAQNAAPAYLYHFNVRTPVHAGKLNTPHCLEMPYVFDNLERCRSVTGGPNPQRQAVADKMGALWSSFARTGVPSAPGVPAWKPFNNRTWSQMVIGIDGLKVVDDPHGEIRTTIASLKASGAAG